MPHRSIEELVSSIAYHSLHDERRNGKRILRRIAEGCETQAEFTAELSPWLDHLRISMGVVCKGLPMQGTQNYEFFYYYDNETLLPPFEPGMLTVLICKGEGVEVGTGKRPPMIFAPRLNLLHLVSSDKVFCSAELGLNRAGEWVLLSGIWEITLRNRTRPRYPSDFRAVSAQARVFTDARLLAGELEQYFPIHSRLDLSSPQRYIAYVLEMIRKERRRQLKAALRQIDFQESLQRSDTDQMIVEREGLPTEVAPTSST